MRLAAILLLILAPVALASDYTRDGGTADWQCCADKACTTIISQHADAVRARDACGRLTDADGVTRYTRSNPFRITSSAAPPPPPPPPPPVTGSAALTWTPPTLNTNGTALTNLTGYRILYGTSPTALTQSIQVSTPTATSHTVTGLASGTWHFAIVAVASTGEAAPTNTASKVVP
jgi:hypothetical protein